MESFHGIFMELYSRSLPKKRIRRPVASVLRQEFQGKGNIMFEGTVLSKTSAKVMITTVHIVYEKPKMSWEIKLGLRFILEHCVSMREF